MQEMQHGFDLWVRKIPWRRKWQPTPVLLLGKSHGAEEPGRLGVEKESDPTDHECAWCKRMLLHVMCKRTVSLKANVIKELKYYYYYVNVGISFSTEFCWWDTNLSLTVSKSIDSWGPPSPIRTWQFTTAETRRVSPWPRESLIVTCCLGDYYQ